MYDIFLHQKNWDPLVHRYQRSDDSAEELPDHVATLIKRQGVELGRGLQVAVLALDDLKSIGPQSTVFAHGTEIQEGDKGPVYQFTHGDIVRVARNSRKVPIDNFGQLVDYYREHPNDKLKFHENHSKGDRFFEPSKLQVGDRLYAVDEIAIDTSTLYVAVSERLTYIGGIRYFDYGIQDPAKDRIRNKVTSVVSAITVVRTTTNPEYSTEGKDLVSRLTGKGFRKVKTQ